MVRHCAIEKYFKKLLNICITSCSIYKMVADSSLVANSCDLLDYRSLPEH